MDKAQDPVCKMFIEPNHELKGSHDGQDYFFCSESCRDEFEKDPAHYLDKKAHAHEAVPAAEGEHKGKMFGPREKFIITGVVALVFIYQGIVYSISLGPQAEGIVLFFPLIAFALGAYCAVMPCCLPVIPGYLAILGKAGQKLSPTKIFLRFFAGLISIILVIGFGFALLGTVIDPEKIGFLPLFLKLLAGIVVLLIGLDLMAGAFGKKFLGLMSLMPSSIGLSHKTREKAKRSLFWQGAIFGTASSPCALLIMTPIIIVSISTGNAILNFSNFLLYGIGRAVPYLVLTFMAEWKRDTIFSFLARKGKKVDIILASLILIAALGIWSELFFEDPLHHLFSFTSPFHEHVGFFSRLKEVFLFWLD